MILGMLLWFNFSLGLQNGGVGDNIFYQELPPIFLTIDVHAENDWLDIYGKYYNGMHPMLPEFAPTQDIFEIGVTFTYQAFSVTIEHGCYHPVSVSPLVDLEGFWGGHNRVMVSFSSKDR